MPAIKACGSRHAAYGDFKTALRTAAADEYPVLLVDSEAPVSQPAVAASAIARRLGAARGADR